MKGICLNPGTARGGAAVRKLAAVLFVALLTLSILPAGTMAAQFYGSAPNGNPQRPDVDLRARNEYHLWKSTTYGYYTAMAVFPDFTGNPPDDFDIEAYSDFDLKNFVIGSYLTPAAKRDYDFLVIYNPNGLADQKAYFARLLFFSGGGGNGQRYDYESDTHTDNVPAGQLAGGENAGPLSVGTDRASKFADGTGGQAGSSVVNGYDVYLYAGGRYDFTLRNVAANAHYDIYLVRGTSTLNTVLARGDYDNVANPDVAEPITGFVAPSTGWYGFVVLQAENQNQNDYTVRVTADYDVAASPSSALVPVGGDTAFNFSVISRGVVTKVDLDSVWVGTAPAGTTVEFFPPSPVIPAGASTNTTTVFVNTTGSTAVGAYTLRLFANDTGVGARSRSSDVILTVSDKADFSLSGRPQSQAVSAGSSAEYTVHVDTINDFAENVTMNASSSPSSATINFTFTPRITNDTKAGGYYNATVRVNTTSATPTGTYTIRINGTNETGVVRWYNATLKVGPPLKLVLVQPTQGELIGDSYTFKAQVVSDNPINEVKFLFDGEMSSLGTVFPVYNAGSGLWEYTVNTNLFSDGQASLNATATDTSGITATAGPRVFTISNIAPAPQIVTPQQGAYISGTTDINVSVGSQVSLVQYRIDDGGFAGMSKSGNYWTAQWNTTTIPDGKHSISVQAKNARGLVGQSSITVWVDNRPPTAALVVPVQNQTIEGVYTFKVLASDLVGVARVDLAVFGSTYPAIYNPSSGLYEYIRATSSVADGTYTATATAYDNVGATASDGPVQFYVDNNPPALTINNPQGDAVVSGPYSVNVSVNDTFLYSVEYKIDAANWVALNSSGAGFYNSTWNTSRFVDGKHTLTVRARDGAFHETLLSISVWVDNNAPTVTLLQPYDDQYIEGTFVIKASAGDIVGVENVTLQMFDDNFTAVLNPSSGFYEYTLNTLPRQDGNYSVLARAADRTGRTTSTGFVVFHIDNRAPALTVNSPSDGSFVAGNVSVNVSASDLFLLSVEYRVDSLNWVPMAASGAYWTAGWNSTRAVDGTHILSIRAMDVLGHSTLQTITLTVDNNNPSASVAGPASGEYIEGTYTFRVSAADTVGVQNVTLRVFGENLTATYNAQSTYYEYTLVTLNYADGTYNISAVVADRSGRVTVTPNATFHVDNTAPTLSVASPSDGAFVDGNITIAVNVTESFLLAVEYRIDSLNWLPMSGGPLSWNGSWNTTLAVDGLHRISIRATDNLTHITEATIQVTADNTPPSVQVGAPAGGQYAEGTLLIQVSAGDTIGLASVVATVFGENHTLTYNGNSGYFEAAVPTIAMEDGTYNLTAVAVDRSGKRSTAGPVVFHLDNHAPTLALLGPDEGLYLDGAVNITANTSDAFIFSVEYRVDSSNWVALAADRGNMTVSGSNQSLFYTVNWSVAWNTSRVPDGKHTLTVRARDNLTHATEMVVAVVVDNTPPTVAVAAPVAEQFVEGTFTLRVAAGDTVGLRNVTVSLFGTAYTAIYSQTTGYYEYTITTLTVADGTYTVTANATDLSGKSSLFNLTFNMDNHAPTMTVVAPPLGGYVSGNYTVEVNSSDLFMFGVEYKLDNNDWAPFGAVNNTTLWRALWPSLLFTDGKHLLRVRATDRASHTTEASLSVTVDNTPPLVAVSNPVVNQFVEGTFTFQVLAADTVGIEHVTLNIYGMVVRASYNAQSGFYEYTLDTTIWLEDAARNVTATAWDLSGKNTTAGPVVFRADNHGPILSIVSPTSGEYVGGKVTFRVNATDAFLGPVEYNIDSSGWVPAALPWDTLSLPDGPHSVQVRAKDLPGHVTLQTMLVYIDNAAPSCSITAPIQTQFVGGSFTFSVLATDANGIRNVTLALFNRTIEIPFNAGSGYYEYTTDTISADDGNYTLHAVATDRAGKRTPAAPVEFRVDNNAPTVLVRNPMNGAYITGEIPLAVDVSDVFLLSVKYSIDDGGLVPVSVPWNTSLVGDGEHKVSVRASDQAGHVTSQTVTVFVDNLAPEITILAPVNGTRVGGVTEVKIFSSGAVKRVLLAVDGASFSEIFRPSSTDPYLYNLDTTIYPDGLHTLNTKSLDFTGHEATHSIALFFDNGAPNLTKREPKAREGSGLVTFRFNVTDDSKLQGAVLILDGVTRIEMVKGADGNYFYRWPTTLNENGKHIYEVRVKDALGNEGVFASTFEVNNPPDYWSELLRAMPFVAFLFVVLLLVSTLLLLRTGHLQRWMRGESMPPKSPPADGEESTPVEIPEEPARKKARRSEKAKPVIGPEGGESGSLVDSIKGLSVQTASGEAPPSEEDGGTLSDIIQGLEKKKGGGARGGGPAGDESRSLDAKGTSAEVPAGETESQTPKRKRRG